MSWPNKMVYGSSHQVFFGVLVFPNSKTSPYRSPHGKISTYTKFWPWHIWGIHAMHWCVSTNEQPYLVKMMLWIGSTWICFITYHYTSNSVYYASVCVCVQQTCATGAWLPFDSSTPTDWSFDRFPSIISCFLDILGFSVILPSTSLSPTGVVATWGCDLLKMVAAAAMLGWEPTRICGRTSKLPTLSLLCGMFHNIDLNQKTKHPYPFFSDSFDVNIDC